MFIHFEDPCQSLLTVVFPTTPKPISPISGHGGTASIAMQLAGLPIVVPITVEPGSASYERNLPDLVAGPA